MKFGKKQDEGVCIKVRGKGMDVKHFPHLMTFLETRDRFENKLEIGNIQNISRFCYQTHKIERIEFSLTH